MILAVRNTAPEICPASSAGITDPGLQASARARQRPIHTLAGMFMPIFEGELRDPRFIELAQAFGYHAVVLFLGRARER